MVMLISILAAPTALAQYSSSKPQYARLDPYGPYQPIYHDWFQEPGGEPAGEEDASAEGSDTSLVPAADSLRIDTSEGHPNFLQPRFKVTQRADAGLDFTDVHGTSTLSGGLELFRRTRNRELSLEYAGGVTLDNSGGTNWSYHQLRLRRMFRGKRWSLLLGNESAYLPEAPFSFVNSSGALISGTFEIDGVSHAFSNAILPTQTLVTGESSRWSTSSVGQMQYQLGARSSVFAVGAFGILRFSNSQLIDGNQAQVLAGYQRVLSPRNKVGITYGLSLYRFSNGISGVNSHSVQASYQRSLTNRLALQVGGGPELGSYHDVVAGDQTKLFWTARGTILYRVARTNLGFTYSHGINGGSGVLAGAQSDSVGMTASRQLTRRWAMTAFGGYAHTSQLRVFTLTAVRPTYDSQFGGVTFYRNVGRDRNLTLGYTMTHQNAATPDCVGACQGGQFRHAFEIGFEWRPRPWKLD